MCRGSDTVDNQGELKKWNCNFTTNIINLRCFIFWSLKQCFSKNKKSLTVLEDFGNLATNVLGMQQPEHLTVSTVKCKRWATQFSSHNYKG